MLTIKKDAKKLANFSSSVVGSLESKAISLISKNFYREWTSVIFPMDILPKFLSPVAEEVK